MVTAVYKLIILCSRANNAEFKIVTVVIFIYSLQPLEFIESLAIQPDYVFKILVVGNSYVGKSSFLMRLCTNAFSQRYASTIGTYVVKVSRQ